jgi:hypothetical protein
VSTPRVVNRNKTPLSVRFTEKDLAGLRQTAARRGEIATVFVREAVLLRVEAMEGGIQVPKLNFEVAGVMGVKNGEPAVSETISVRFRPSDFRRVAHQAAVEGQPPGPWVRAIVVEYIARQKLAPMRQVAVGE